MKVLFIGGTGLISTAVSRLAVTKGMELYLLNRGQREEFVPEGARVIQADIRDENAVRDTLKDEKYDVVVDWIGFTPEHVETDIHLFKGKVGQYIFISSASAYQKPVTHYLVTESTPLANPFWQYSRDKIACEERLMEEYRSSGFPVVIVRPSFTYGEPMIPFSINSWHKPWSLVDRIRQGKKVIVHGDGTSLWTMTHNTDFAKGFLGLLGNIQTLGHAFHITSDEVLSWDQIMQVIGKAAGAEPEIVHIPSEFIAAFSPDEVGNLLGDKAVSVILDNTKIKRFVPGYTATVSFAEGVRKAIAWFETHPERCIVDGEWNALVDRIIEAYESGMNKV